ncbi:MAG: RdgB/HAM1 family non-canonical purine NTP pyrophosphatase [Halobacteriales archaeon]|nr:RdgB/HAM1 family non-canonical purine NTP pyrophosphatase [Halobacteriales archaeon]
MIHFDRLVVASKNPDKIAEIESVLTEMGVIDAVVRDLEWPDVEETGSTLEDNALLKARTVCEVTGLPALADDTGLEVAALDGAPGVYSARFSGPDATYESNVEKLLAELDGSDDRRARFRTVVAVVAPDGRTWTAEGVLDGVIATERRGDGGFGYDPVFDVDGRTLAEMGTGEKNAVSHRGRAVRAIAARLSE